MQESYREIVEGCLAGERTAQEKLYNLYAGNMYTVCLRYSGDTEEAKDILQDGFIKVFQNLSSFKGTGSLEGWVRRIMINTALERYRKTKHVFVSDDIQEDAGDEAYYTAVEDLSAKELIDMIQELSPKYRMVFNLYALEGYSHKEISNMLGISEGTSKSNLSRARTILQDKLVIYRKEWVGNNEQK